MRVSVAMDGYVDQQYAYIPWSGDRTSLFICLRPVNVPAGGHIGVNVTNLYDLRRDRYGVKEGGVFVEAVIPGEAGVRAGIQAEDIITAVNGTPITDGAQFVKVILALQPGATVPVRIVREHEARDIAVTVEKNSPASPAHQLIRFSFQPPADGAKKLQEMTNPRDGAAMVWVPAGDFLMGSVAKDLRALEVDEGIPATDDDEFSAEMPLHAVYLDGYWCYKYPVTVAQYRAFCRATG